MLMTTMMVKMLSLILGQILGTLDKLFRASLYVTEYHSYHDCKVTIMPIIRMITVVDEFSSVVLTTKSSW